MFFRGQGGYLAGPKRSTGRFDGSSDDLEGIYAYISDPDFYCGLAGRRIQQRSLW